MIVLRGKAEEGQQPVVGAPVKEPAGRKEGLNIANEPTPQGLGLVALLLLRHA